MGVSHSQGYLFEIPYDKDCSILGSTLGSPIEGNYHIGFWARFMFSRLWVGIIDHECFLKVVTMPGYRTVGQCIAIPWLWGGLGEEKRLSGLEKADGVRCLDSGYGYEVSFLPLVS